MSKWKTIGISVRKESGIQRGRDLIDITKRYFDLFLSDPLTAKAKIKKDKDFAAWRSIIYG